MMFSVLSLTFWMFYIGSFIFLRYSDRCIWGNFCVIVCVVYAFFSPSCGFLSFFGLLRLCGKYRHIMNTFRFRKIQFLPKNQLSKCSTFISQTCNRPWLNYVGFGHWLANWCQKQFYFWYSLQHFDRTIACCCYYWVSVLLPTHWH